MYYHAAQRARRTERRNRSAHKVQNDFEHRSTKQLNHGINRARTICKVT